MQYFGNIVGIIIAPTLSRFYFATFYTKITTGITVPADRFCLLLQCGVKLHRFAAGLGLSHAFGVC